jgi:hypothetical protein
MENNLISLATALVKKVQSLDGFATSLIEEEVIDQLAQELEEGLRTREDRVLALRNMFHLGQVFNKGRR